MHALFHYILSSFCVFFEVITDFCMPAHNDLQHSTMCNFFFFFFFIPDVGVRTSFSTCNVAKYYYSESSQLGDTTL